MAIVTSALLALALVPQPISLVTPAKALVTEVLIVVVKSLVHSAKACVITISSTATSSQPAVGSTISKVKYNEVLDPTVVAGTLRLRRFQSLAPPLLEECGKSCVASAKGVVSVLEPKIFTFMLKGPDVPQTGLGPAFTKFIRAAEKSTRLLGNTLTSRI